MIETIIYLFRHASRYTSPERTREEDRLAQQNENLVHYIESWFTLARELIREYEQSLMVDQQMIDEKKIVHGSMLTSDNNSSTHLLFQLKVSLIEILLEEKNLP
jgi:L-rhamnose isomerase